MTEEMGPEAKTLRLEPAFKWILTEELTLGVGQPSLKAEPFLQAVNREDWRDTNKSAAELILSAV